MARRTRRVEPAQPDPSELSTAVRVFTTRRSTRQKRAPKEPRPRAGVLRRYPDEALVFDTETFPGPAQSLRILVWRLYRDRSDGIPGTTCIEEGIAYPDDLREHDPAGFQVLQEYVNGTEAAVSPGSPVTLRLEPLSWWLDKRLFRYGHAHADRCAIVGFNLLFDLGRLALYWTSARGRYRGGFSLGLWGRFDGGRWKYGEFRPRLQLRAIDPRRTLFRWSPGTPKDPDWRGPGRFVDLRTLSFALTDRSHTLESACAAFGDSYEKAEVDYERLTHELLEYAREDVRHTALLYRNCLAELRRHEGIRLEPYRLYSPATVGTRYLEAMGLRQPLLKFTALTAEELGWDPPPQDEGQRGDLDPRLLGWAMSAFHGGRAEARIVRTLVPVVLVDFTSMYPSVNALLGTWELLCAERLSVVDATDAVRRLLDDRKLLERCLTQELWRELGVTLVELEPEGDLLPVRARYDPDSDDYGIGLTPFSYKGRLWYALPDVVAAVILSPLEYGSAKVPRIVRALRLEPAGVQEGLRSVRLRGGRLIDPLEDDPFVRMIEERQRILGDAGLEDEERKRLERFLKITANATAYGVLARFDRRERASAVPVSVYGPEPQPFQSSCKTPEDPGPFCFPPVACAITAAARLMLAVLERLLREADGSYAFCDTDSMAIVASPRGRRVACPTASGDRIQALSWAEVKRLLARFDGLNPYDHELVPSLWKAEESSLERELSCYAISAKRYCLYRPTRSGGKEIVAAIDDPADEDPIETEELLADWSEHGLGLYLDPTARDLDRPRRDRKGRRLWVAQAWRWILRRAEEKKTALPSWASTYALTRFTVSSPTLERWFSGYNRERPRTERVRPGSFGLIAHPLGLGPGDDSRPSAPYEGDSARWPELDWYDRRTGRPVRVLTIAAGDDAEARAHALARGDVPIRTLGDVLSQYRRRPEHKSLAPDAAPAGAETVGLLRRRPVRSTPVESELIGKEGNKLEERLTGEVLEQAEYQTSYGRRVDPWTELVLPVLREIGARTLAEQTGFKVRSIYDVLMRGARPHPRRQAVYEERAIAHARRALEAMGDEVPASGTAILQRYLYE
jgi:hypothetical protein